MCCGASFWYVVNEMDNANLDKQRDEVIAKIEKAFPKERQPKGKAKLMRGGDEPKDLKEVLEGKSWQEVIYHPYIVYYLSDVDDMVALSKRAYDYYFPAFLIASMNEPNKWIIYTFVLEYMDRLAERSKVARLEALAAWLEFQLEYLSTMRLMLSQMGLPEDKQVSAIKATLQKINCLIDEKASSS